MIRSVMGRIVLLGFAALAFPLSGIAALVLVPLNTPTVAEQTIITIDLETGAYLIGGSVAGTDFTFSLSSGGRPDYLMGSFGSSNAAFSSTLALLAAGVTVNASLGSFQQFAYFPNPTAAGTYFLGFQTDADLDLNPLTTGVSYGFFQVAVGSLAVTGYGFESVPGVGAITTPVPEPTVGILGLLAIGGAVAFRRYQRR